jgi:hypothetical protein
MIVKFWAGLILVIGQHLRWRSCTSHGAILPSLPQPQPHVENLIRLLMEISSLATNTLFTSYGTNTKSPSHPLMEGPPGRRLTYTSIHSETNGSGEENLRPLRLSLISSRINTCFPAARFSYSCTCNRKRCITIMRVTHAHTRTSSVLPDSSVPPDSTFM